MNSLKFSDSSPRNRSSAIIRTASISIISNIILALLKIGIGLFLPSIAILSEGVNNIADSLSSVITIIGVKLSSKTSEENAKFRHAEHIGSLVISLIILTTGIQFLKKSVLLLFHPVDMRISVPVIIIMSASAIFKIFLSQYTIKQGKLTRSISLIAIGIECRNDFIISSITLISYMLFIIFGIYADAVAGIISSTFILKSDLGILAESLRELLKKG